MRFLFLASNRIDPPEGSGFISPYNVELSVEGPRPRVGFSEGVAHGAAGGHFGLRDALGQGWRKLIREARGEWLLDYMHRLARGGPVTEQELIDDFTARHGYSPKASEWKIRPVPARFLQLAVSDDAWPVVVDISVDERPGLVVFSDGTGPMSSGGVFSVAKALAPESVEHIAKAGGEWLVPFLRELVVGDDVSEQTLIDAYVARHGHPPGSYELTTMNWRG